MSITFNGNPIRIGKVICVGRNFVKHIEELNNEFPEFMVLFQKSASAVAEELVHPGKSCRFEAEISLLMDRTKMVGVGAGLDLTLDIEQNYLKEKGLPWERAKSFKKSAVFTPFIPFDGDLNELELTLYKNSGLKQHARPEKMIYDFNEIIRQSEEAFGLERYDIIMTGTPEGVDHFKVDDQFDIELLYKHAPLIRHHWDVVQ
jgi:2-keto-4-pentenoate hydratase/2-oxohepta-3-ene-1,7-dioic acid hydratase in catechol pathway